MANSRAWSKQCQYHGFDFQGMHEVSCIPQKSMQVAVKRLPKCQMRKCWCWGGGGMLDVLSVSLYYTEVNNK